MLLVAGGCIAAWTIVRGGKPTATKIGSAVTVALVCILGGGLLLLQERATKLTVSKLGSIEASAAKAESDAKAITDLRTRVESQSATVDLVAKDAADARHTVGVVEQRSSEATAKLIKLEHTINELETKVSAAQAEVDFSTVLIRASRGHRESFDRLLEIIKAPNDHRSQAALGVLTSIASDPFLGGIGSKMEWKEVGIDPASGTLPEIFNALQDKLGPLELPRTIDALWGLERFPKYDRLEFLAATIRQAPTVNSLHRACMLMNAEAKLGKNVLAYHEYLDWWEKNAARYKEQGKP